MPRVLSAVFPLQWLQELKFRLPNSTLLDGIPSEEFQIHLCKETILQNWRINLPQILLLFLQASETPPPPDRDYFLCRVVLDCCVESYWDQLFYLYWKGGYTGVGQTVAPPNCRIQLEDPLHQRAQPSQEQSIANSLLCYEAQPVALSNNRVQPEVPLGAEHSMQLQWT